MAQAEIQPFEELLRLAPLLGQPFVHHRLEPSHERRIDNRPGEEDSFAKASHTLGVPSIQQIQLGNIRFACTRKPFAKCRDELGR